MKRVVSLLSLALVAVSFSALAQQDSIDVFISRQMKQQGIAGLSIGIIENGKVVKAKGYGLANIELNVPVSEKTIFKIASVSKQFVAVGIMKLVQEGRMKVTDPVTKFIKGAPAKWNSITVRHLLTHSSGVAVEPPGFDGMKEEADSVYIKRSFADSLNFVPGSKFEYSNFGYFILADIIRIISNMPFPDYMKKHVFDEGGLSSTGITSLEAIIPDRAAGYMKGADHSIINAPNYVAVRPSGAFLSNINDLLKWEMDMQAGKLLTQKNWDQVWGDTVKTSFTMDDEVMYYGYGWMINKVNGKQFMHHGGSLPGFKSVYLRYVEDKTAIIILTNCDDADAYGIAFGVADLLRGKGK